MVEDRKWRSEKEEVGLYLVRAGPRRCAGT